MVPPADSVLVKTWQAGVIDRDVRGEVKVFLHNWSDEDFPIYSGDRVAQLVIEKILEVGANSLENLRGFGYSGHEEAHPWADPDDPLNQRQELGTNRPRLTGSPSGRCRSEMTVMGRQ